MLRMILVVAVVVVPGALVVLGAWALARILGRHLHEAEGPGPRRLARAVARVRLADVTREIRRVV